MSITSPTSRRQTRSLWRTSSSPASRHLGRSVGAFYSAAGATSAHDSTDRIVYNTTTGALFYDADGNQAGGDDAVQFAVLDNHPTLTRPTSSIICHFAVGVRPGP